MEGLGINRAMRELRETLAPRPALDITHYAIVPGTTGDELVHKVEEFINQGYVPQGGIAVTYVPPDPAGDTPQKREGYCQLVQAMIKYR